MCYTNKCYLFSGLTVSICLMNCAKNHAGLYLWAERSSKRYNLGYYIYCLSFQGIFSWCEQLHFSTEAMFCISSVTEQKRVCCEKLLGSTRITESALKQKHQEKPSSSLSTHTKVRRSLGLLISDLVLPHSLLDFGFS